uniref:Uncharacterized protein n=1 Tax=Sipha flava TaxID=143950 RepID=A0A2S2QDF6_9HEMI
MITIKKKKKITRLDAACFLSKLQKFCTYFYDEKVFTRAKNVSIISNGILILYNIRRDRHVILYIQNNWECSSRLLWIIYYIIIIHPSHNHVSHLIYVFIRHT